VANCVIVQRRVADHLGQATLLLAISPRTRCGGPSAKQDDAGAQITMCTMVDWVVELAAARTRQSPRMFSDDRTRRRRAGPRPRSSSRVGPQIQHDQRAQQASITPTGIHT